MCNSEDHNYQTIVNKVEKRYKNYLSTGSLSYDDYLLTETIGKLFCTKCGNILRIEVE